jgi:hypothetical protein
MFCGNHESADLFVRFLNENSCYNRTPFCSNNIFLQQAKLFVYVFMFYLLLVHFSVPNKKLYSYNFEQVQGVSIPKFHVMN